VLCGSQGVGKNSFVEPLGKLLGPHFAPLSNISELVSNFNYHLKNAVLIHANEALWGGHRKDIGTIKAMITDPYCYIEGKGKDRIPVRNFRHVILSSNEDWPIHLDADDRRFLVLQASEKHKEDRAYFLAIKQELENGGYEALLYDLLHEDVSNFDPRQLPANSNSFAIKMRSADSAHRYLHSALNEGGFSIATMSDNNLPVWHPIIPKDSIYEDYTAWCEKSREEPLIRESFGRALKKLIKSVEDTRPGGGSRLRCYKFLSLRQTQEDFSKAFKEKPERIFDSYDDGVQALVQDDLL
jgi:phage/plasmid-associated DNA primase